MPNNATAATVVGNKFAFEYYTTLSENPQNISTYYKMESALTSGVGSFDVKDNSDDAVETHFGTTNIEKKINAMKFAGCKVVISNINCQESLNGGVIVVVLGNIALKANETLQTPRAFAQTFFLGVQTEPIYSYYVLNDIFTFVNVNVAPSTTHGFSLPKSVPSPIAPINFTVASNVNHNHPNVVTSTAPQKTTHVEPSPIPHPQSSPPPQIVHQPVQPVQQPAPQPVVSKPAESNPIPPATTTAPVTHTSANPATNNAHNGSQEKPKKEKKTHIKDNNATNNTDSPRSSSEWKQIGKRNQNRPNKSPRNRRDGDEQKGDHKNEHKGEHKGEHKHDHKEQREHKNDHKEQREHNDKKREGRKDNNNKNRRHENKKSENNETNNTSAQQSNGATESSGSFSWAKIAVDGATKSPDSTVAVFRPASVVYNAPVVVAQSPEPEKVEKVEKKDKPKKDRKKEVDPIKLAKKKTKELRSVRVGNIPYEATDEQIKKHFSAFGDVYEVVLRNGYGYVEYDSVTGVTNILNAVKKEKLFLGGRELKIEPRQPKQSQEPDKPFYKEEKKLEQNSSTTSVPATTTSP